jgi:hypothetical protein
MDLMPCVVKNNDQSILAEDRFLGMLHRNPRFYQAREIMARLALKEFAKIALV